MPKHVWMQLKEGKRAMTEVVSVTTTKHATPAETFRAVVVVLLAICLCVMMIGFADRAEQGGNWRWSFKAWLDDIQSIFESFPVPETALDYLMWTVQVIGWFVLLWGPLLNSGWTQEPFDGSVGAVPVTRELAEGVNQP